MSVKDIPVRDIPVRVIKMSEQEEAADLRKTSTPQERLEITWQLSQNAWAFKGEPVAEGSSRHIVRVIRRTGMERRAKIK